MTCGSRVAQWVSVRLLLAEYMRKLPYNRSRTGEAELMLRLCSSFEQWGCVGATFKLCSAFSEIIRCSTSRCKDSVSRWSSWWTLEQAPTWKSLQGTTDCLCSRENCQGRPNTMSILGEWNGLFFWRRRCVSVMICNIWYKLLTTDCRQWDLYPFSGRQNSPLADNFLPTYGTNASPPDKPLNVNFSFLALSLPGMLPWGSSCRNSVYLAA